MLMIAIWLPNKISQIQFRHDLFQVFLQYQNNVIEQP